MTISSRSGRLRLDGPTYEALRLEVLKRDGWRCQWCGTRANLEVHHQRHRSRGGPDLLENLITLCSTCHAGAHRLSLPLASKG